MLKQYSREGLLKIKDQTSQFKYQKQDFILPELRQLEEVYRYTSVAQETEKIPQAETGQTERHLR